MLRTDWQLQSDHVHPLGLAGAVFVQGQKLGEEEPCLHWGLVFSALGCLAVLVHQPGFTLYLKAPSRSRQQWLSAWGGQGCDSDTVPIVSLVLALCSWLFCLIRCFLGGHISVLPHCVSDSLREEEWVLLLSCKLTKLKLFAKSGR